MGVTINTVTKPCSSMAPLPTLSLMLALVVTPSLAARKSYGSSCYSCGQSQSQAFYNGQALGGAVSGHFAGKLQHLAGFINGLGGGGGGGCGGCSSSCGSPGCGSHYAPAPNPCSSGGCYSSCSSGGCGGGSSSNTVIVIQPFSSSSGGHHSSGYSAAAYPNCQCDYLFNGKGQGNCNGHGARSYTSDRFCYVSENVGGQWIEAQWACPDAVGSDVHHGRFWSRVACDTPTYG